MTTLRGSVLRTAAVFLMLVVLGCNSSIAFAQRSVPVSPLEAETKSETTSETSTTTGKLPIGIEAYVEVGLGGVCHLGRVNPVSVLVVNKNTESIFTCTIELLADVNTYTYDMSVGAGDAVEATFFVDFDPPPGSLLINLKSRSGRSMFLRKYDFKHALGPEDALVMTATDLPGIMSFLDKAPVITRSQAYLGKTTNALQPGNIGVGHVSLERLLDVGLRSLAAVDVLVIHSGDFSRITENDMKSLQAFAAAGGTIITSAGIDGKKLSESALSSILPMKTNSAEPSTELDGLSAYAGVPLNEGVSAIVASGGAITNDAVTLAGSTSNPLIVQRPYGFGRVIQINLNFAQNSIRSWQGWLPLWRKLLLPSLSSKSVESKMLTPGRVLDTLTRIPQTEPIPLSLASLFIVIYITLVGPVNYAVLARRKKRTLLWISIPLVIVAFGIFSVALGYLWRGTSNIIRSVDEVHHFENIPVSVARNYTMYFSAASGIESTVIDATDVLIRTLDPPVPDTNNYWYAPTTRNDERKPSRITYSPQPSLERRVNKWTPYNLWTEFTDYSEANHVELSPDSKTTLNFNFESPVTDSWVLAKDGKYRIGKLAKEGALDLDTPFGILGTFSNEKGSLNSIRGDLISSLPDFSSLGTDSTYTLITYTDKIKDKLEFTRRYVRETATFDFYHVKFKDWNANNPLIEISITGFDTNKQPGVPRSSGSMYGYSDSYGLISLVKDETITFRASVTPSDPTVNYILKINSVVQYDWQAKSALEYDVEVRADTFQDIQTGLTNGQYELKIPGRSVAKNGIDIKLNPKGSMTIKSIELTIEKLK